VLKILLFFTPYLPIKLISSYFDKWRSSAETVLMSYSIEKKYT
jgi:hypothetical protein